MDKSNFAQGSVKKIILSIALPMMVAQLTSLLYSIVDRIYLGHLHDLSNIALTAIGLSLPLNSIILAFCNLFSTGGLPLCSMAKGKGDLNQATLMQGNTFALLVISSIIITLVAFVGLKPILFLFGASSQSYPYAREYLEIYLLGTLFTMVGTGMLPFLNVQGKAFYGMVCVISGALLNLILDPLFIFYLDLKIQGAAIASVIAQAVVFVLVMRALWAKDAVLKFDLTSFKLSFARFKQIVGLGSAGFVMASTNGAVQIACNLTLKNFGGDLYIGIMTILMALRDLTFEPTKCLTHSAQPVISYNYGAGLKERVYEAISFMTKSTALYMALAWSLIVLFPEPLLSLFNADGKILEEAVHATHIYFFGLFFMAFHASGQNVFVGLGFAKKAIFFALFRKVLVVVPLTLILPYCFDLKEDGVFLAEPISNFLSGILCYSVLLYTLKHVKFGIK